MATDTATTAATVPTDPDELEAILQQLATPDEFWRLIADWVSDIHLSRRRGYYRARFQRDNIQEPHRISRLSREFLNDATGQDVHFRTLCGLPDDSTSPFSSLVELDEFLATIHSITTWPDERLPFMHHDYETLCDLVTLGVMPADNALETLKRYTRSEITVTYALPVLPIT